MASDASELPVTDFEAAASLPYDTDIPDGKFDMKIVHGLINHAYFSCLLLSISVCLFACFCEGHHSHHSKILKDVWGKIHSQLCF